MGFHLSLACGYSKEDWNESPEKNHVRFFSKPAGGWVNDMIHLLSPTLVCHIQDTLLQAFWTRKGIKAFLNQHFISSKLLKFRDEVETKKDFLARLFPVLLAMENLQGHAMLRRVAETLAEMTEFPDLAGYDDTPQKILAAQAAVLRLKREMERWTQQQPRT